MFAGAGKTDPRFRFNYSRTSAGRRGGDVTRRLVIRVVPLFVPSRAPFLRPGLMIWSACAQRRSRMAIGHRRRRRGASLTVASTAQRSCWLGECITDASALVVAAPGQYRPGDTGQFVCERDREHVAGRVVQGRPHRRAEVGLKGRLEVSQNGGKLGSIQRPSVLKTPRC